MRRLLVGGIVGLLVGCLVTVAYATHEDGHTSVQANGPDKVKIVRHAFPHPLYNGAQWMTDSSAKGYVQIPGATTSITIPAGEKAVIVVRFNAAIICQGTGACNFRLLIGGVEGHPIKPVTVRDGWMTVAVDRSRGPLRPGTYQVRAQVENTYGTSGNTTYVRSFHMTVERLPV